MILVFLLQACAPDPGSPWASYDQDRDGAMPPEDCDDDRADVNAAASELCNGRDDDCDGEVDEDAVDARTFFEDRDGDGFGDAGAPVLACEATATTTADTSDCDDTRAEAHPGADETCNGLDDDCDGAVDDAAIDVVTRWADEDGDGYGDADARYVGCTPPAGSVDDDDDCDDTDADIHPEAPEPDCTDPVDYDCNGHVVYADDDGDGWAACVDCDDDDAELTEPLTWYADADRDGYGDPDAKSVDCFVPDGYTDDASDCDDTTPSISPVGAEVCDSRWTDEDCDGVADDDDPSATGQTPWYGDADGDGYAGTLTAVTCHAPAATVSLPDDCDDADADDHPGGVETCNDDDEDCDGAIDDGVLVMYYADDDGDGYGDPFDPTYACSVPTGYVADDTDCAPDDASVYPDASGVCVSPSIRFLVVGDTGAGDTNQYTVGAAMADVCALEGCDFVLLVGDNFYPSGVTSTTDPQFESAFELPYAELSQQFWAVMGNHDWNHSTDTMYLDAQVGYTALSPKWYMPADFYTRTAGDVTFYALDTEMIDAGLGADQETWLPLQRAGTTTTWNIAYGHHPYRSNGPHGDADPNVGTFMETYVCGQYDVYFAGHDHNLQWIEDTCGTAFLVSGAGHSSYPLGGTNPVYFEAASLGFLWVEIAGRDFTGVFYDETGAELYRRTFSK